MSASDAALAADLDLVRRAARLAGAEVMRWFGTDLDVQHKAPDQPLTQADLAANAILHEELIGARPGYGWLSEETQDHPDRLDREYVWVVDPIDGTRSFIAGHPEFSISVGLVRDGAPVAGVVYNPARDELFHAVRGGGAHVECGGGDPVRVGSEGGATGVTRRTLLASRSEIAAGEFETFDEFEIRPAGSTAYKLACVAWGRGDAFVSRGPKSEWDICAGVLLVEEAGGRVTDLNGERAVFNRADPYVHGTIAAPQALHADLLQRIARLPATARLRNRQRDPLHPGLDEGTN